MFECGWPHSLGLETSLLEQGCNPVAEEYFKTMDIDKSGKVTYVACSRMGMLFAHSRHRERLSFRPPCSKGRVRRRHAWWTGRCKPPDADTRLQFERFGPGGPFLNGACKTGTGFDAGFDRNSTTR